LRDRLLAEGMTHILRSASPPEDVIADPYFAGITGQVFARDEALSAWDERLFVASPLTLFDLGCYSNPSMTANAPLPEHGVSERGPARSLTHNVTVVGSEDDKNSLAPAHRAEGRGVLFSG